MANSYRFPKISGSEPPQRPPRKAFGPVSSQGRAVRPSVKYVDDKNQGSGQAFFIIGMIPINVRIFQKDT